MPASNEIERLISLLAKLPGLGPRSARRAALQLIKKKDALLMPLADAMAEAAEHVGTCSICGNVDTVDPCGVCASPRRDKSIICVVEEVADLWALERAGVMGGLYHVLGGVMSPLDGITADELNMAELFERMPGIDELIIATHASIEGDTTALFIAQRAEKLNINVTRLSRGLPVGANLEYTDEATLASAYSSRVKF